MSYTNVQTALNQYRTVGVQSTILDATPHRLIQMLMEGVLDRLHSAKGCMAQGKMAEKGKLIGAAISIVEGLRASLDMNAGGEIAGNLDALYEYMNRRLFEANVKNDAAAVEEVANLMAEIKAGWDAIPEQMRSTPQHPEARVGG